MNERKITSNASFCSSVSAAIRRLSSPSVSLSSSKAKNCASVMPKAAQSALSVESFAIQAFGFKKDGLPLIALAFVLQIGQLILACVAAESFAFVLNFWTLIAIVLFAIALFFARRKN